MLGSPVEVRYDDGDSVVLIQADTGPSQVHGAGSGGVGGVGNAAPQANGSHQSAGDGGAGEGGRQEPHHHHHHHHHHAEQGGGGGPVGSGHGPGEASRIIIHDRNGAAGGGITILTPNNVKISINQKRRYPGTPEEYQRAKRVLTHDLRHKLDELGQLLQACDDEEAQGPSRVSPNTSGSSNGAANGAGSELASGSSPTGAAPAATDEDPFNSCEDVLVRISNDNQYYLGTVIEYEPQRSCLVRFEDQRTVRVELSRVKRMGGGQTNGCAGATSSSSNSNSPVPFASGSGRENGDTTVAEPAIINVKREPGTGGGGGPSRSIVIPGGFTPLTSVTQLPYELQTLSWDRNHCMNAEGHYCYCGEDGEWTREMLQCHRCDQWFHGRCIRSLQFPIFLGDCFYLFLCSICNQGHEFVRRLELSVVSLTHLVLYNLIMRNGCRLYDLRTAIMPYIEDNQRTLQLPDAFLRLSASERTDAVMQTLRNNPDRFLNGRDMGIHHQLWTLREAQPPSSEPFNLPLSPEKTVTEHMLMRLNELFGSAGSCRILPRTNHEKNFVMDAVSRERMLGLKYAEQPTSVADPRVRFAELSIPLSPIPSTSRVTTPLQSVHTAAEAAASVPIAGPSRPRQVTPAVARDETPPVGARKRKQRGVHYRTPCVRPLPDALEQLVPPLPNYDGPNNPFYGGEPVYWFAGRGRGRKVAGIRRQGRRPHVSRESSLVRGGGTAARFSRGGSTSGTLPRIDENAVLSELSVQNVQRHNNVHATVPAYRRRSSRSYSTSSTSSEQVGVTAPTHGDDGEGSERGAGSAVTDDSSQEQEQAPQAMASGRRSSGRLLALPTRNYSDTRRRKRRRNSEPTLEGGYFAEGLRSTRSRAVSGVECSSSSCSSHVASEPNDRIRNLRHRVVTVVGRRTLPDGQQELLLEEQ